ncbi:hypothetical protein EZS27_005867 [termite gut metagenome]|uniref:Insertion element IS1 protein InsA helix-turn-helix domain-containing protein n=1 Tax=termite gut metagenome TaxID=433724 RepID=A0A5J4SLD5_9ZZZZ
MIHSEAIHCPYCHSNALQKNGKSCTGEQRWRCKECKKYFQRSYRYNARKQGIRDTIIEMTLDSSGVRDIGRVLKISKDTVVAVLKKNARHEPVFHHQTRATTI